MGSLNLSVKDVMIENLVVLNCQQSIEEAAKVMTALNVGALAVADDKGDLVGMFSERDILKKIVSQGLDYTKETVETHMSSPVMTVPISATAEEAWEIMSKKKIRHVPVIDESGKAVGMLGARALLEVLHQYFVDLFIGR